MRAFIADIVPKISKFSQRLDDLTKLTNQHWVSIGDIAQSKRVFIFRANCQLLISENGIVEKGLWEYLGNQSLLIETIKESYLFKHGFFDENVIALKLDSTERYVFFVNESKFHRELNSIDDILKFLENKYLKNQSLHKNMSTNGRGTIPEEFKYKVLSEEECYDVVFGRHIVFKIKYMNDLVDKVYKGYKSGEYFYIDFMTPKVYCQSFDDAVYRLYLDRTKRNNR